MYGRQASSYNKIVKFVKYKFDLYKILCFGKFGIAHSFQNSFLNLVLHLKCHANSGLNYYVIFGIQIIFVVNAHEQLITLFASNKYSRLDGIF